MSTSDGSTADYYELPAGATELQDLISHRNLNAQDGEIFRAIYRKGRASHSDELRDARKVLFYAQAEVARLEHLKDGSALAEALGQQNQLDTGAMRFETVRDWVKWAWNGSFIPGNPREDAISAVKRSNGRLIIRELGFQAGPFKDGGFTGKGCLNASPVGGPMLRCHDCIAEHCPCVAK